MVKYEKQFGIIIASDSRRLHAVEYTRLGYAMPGNSTAVPNAQNETRVDCALELHSVLKRAEPLSIDCVTCWKSLR